MHAMVRAMYATALYLTALAILVLVLLALAPVIVGLARAHELPVHLSDAAPGNI